MLYKPLHISRLSGFVLIVFFTLACSTNNISAQQFIYENFTVDDGLPSTECYDVVQDEKGYIWVATDKGIAKYNGQTFKVFDQTDGMKSSVVFRLMEKNGRIWFFTYNKWLQYIEGDSVVTPGYSSQLWATIDSLKAAPSEISVNEKNEVIISLRQMNLPHLFLEVNKAGNINCQNFSDLKKNHYYIISEFGHEPISSLGLDSIYNSPSILSVSFFNNKKLMFSVYLNQIGYESFGKGGVSFSLNRKDIEIVSVYNSIYSFNQGKKEDSIQTKDLLSGALLKIDSSTFIYGRNKNSMLVIKRVEGMFSKVDSINKELSGVSGGCKDQEKGLWLSSLERGLFYLKDPRVKNFKLDDDKELGEIIGLASCAGRIWVANKKSLMSINPSRSIAIAPADLAGEIFSITSNGSQLVVLSAVGKESYNDSFHLINATGRAFPSGDSTWFAGTGGIYLKMNNDYVFKRNFANGLSAPIKCLYKKRESLYLGSINGIKKYDIKNEVILHEEDVNTEIKFRVNAIESYGKNLVLATGGSGVCVINDQDSIILRIKNSNGLSSNFCNSIFKENDSTYWVSTNKGVSKLVFDLTSDTIKYKIKVLNKSHGLVSDEVTHCLVANNRLYIGTKIGLCYLDLNYDFSNTNAPSVFIEQVIVNDSVINVNNIKPFSYDHNNFQFHFAGLTFKTRGKFRFKYRLIKDDDNINFTYINQPRIQFSDLSHGNYSFEVLAVNNDKVESENAAVYNFEISPPIWETWWFRMIGVFILSFIIYFSIKYRNNQIKTTNELELKTKKLKQQALNAQLNPHFIFNTMGSIQSLIMDRKLPEAEGYLTKFSKMLRTILSSSDEHFSKLTKEIDLVMEYVKLENLRFGNRIDLVLNIQKLTSADEFRVPTLLILTIVENAILHGILPSKKPGRIIISAYIHEEDNSQLLLSIEDNGIGISKSKKLKKKKIDRHKSRGLNIIKNRLETYSSLYKSNFSINFIDLSEIDKNRTGTRVEIFAPYRILNENEKN